MNVLNRIIMVVGILIALVVATYVMVDPYGSVMIARNALDNWDQLLYDDQFYGFFLLGLGGVDLILLVLLWLELRKSRRKTARIRTKRGAAELGLQSVAQSLEFRIDELAGVRKVKTHIVSHGRDVGIRVDLDTSPSVNIPVLTDQIANLCHDIVEGQLGVKIHGKVQINVKHEPYPRGTMPPTAPLGEKLITRPPEVQRPEAEPSRSPATAAEPIIREEPPLPTPEPVQPTTGPARVERVSPLPSEIAHREARPVAEPVEITGSWADEEPTAEPTTTYEENDSGRAQADTAGEPEETERQDEPEDDRGDDASDW